MKVFKLLWILCALSFGFVSCDDDDNNEPNGEGGGGNVPQVAVAFEKDAMTVLKNAGEIQIPIVLAEAPEGAVKLTVGVKEQTGTVAAEGIDFDIREKVISIEKGNQVGYVSLILLDNGKAETDRSFILEIKNVYGYGKKAAEKQICEISIMNNAFVEFEKNTWTTWESAATEGVPAEWKESCRIPLLITGEIAIPSTIVIQAIDSTANEYYHFTLASKEITVNPGDTKVYVNLLPVDDDLANDDRNLTLVIKEIKGGNLAIGKNNLNCEVTIVSEEVKKTVSFEKLTYTEIDKEKMLEIPVIIDKVPDNDVTVTLAPTVNSTAVEGVDYELKAENRTVTIGASKTASVFVKLLGDNIVNGDRQLILALRSVKGSNAYLSETESLCTIDINNDDFPTFEKGVFEVEEGYGAYQITVSIPPVDKERIMKFTIENEEAHPGTYFQNLPSEVIIPANAEQVNIDLSIGINYPAMASVTPTLKLSITEVDRFTLETPVQTEIQVIVSGYRKWLGAWAYKDNKYNVDCKFTAGETDEEIQANWGKKYIIKPFLWNSGWVGQMNYEQGRLRLNDSYIGKYDFNDGKGPMNGRVMYWNLETDKGWYTGSDYLIIVSDNEIKLNPNRKMCLFWYVGNSAIYSTDERATISFIRK